jgi:sugar phosphate isomerase/epimerase
VPEGPQAGERPLGIERLCVFGAMPPDRFVRFAADLGCQSVGIGLTAMRYYDPDGCEDWSLRDDAGLRRATRAAMQDSGVEIALCEGFGPVPQMDPARCAADLDLLAELGGGRIGASSMDKDFGRTADGFAVLAEMAAERAIEVVIEIGPGPIRDLEAALAAVRHVGRANFRLLVDTMHFFRFGGQAADLARIDPALIGYVQLCDAPRACNFPSYMDEALHDRLPPGEGELPLLGLLEVVPRETVISVEVPRRVLAARGDSPAARVGPVVAAARRLLAVASRPTAR